MDFFRSIGVSIDNKDAAAKISDALRGAKVVKIIGGPSPGPETLVFWESVIRRIGTIDERHDDSMTLKRYSAVWWNLIFDPQFPNTYRHSNTRQPLHTDGAFNDSPPDCVFFCCEKAAKAGGATYFIDSLHLLDVLDAEAADLASELREVPIAFVRGNNPGQTVPVITFDALGPVLNWNHFRVDPGQNERALKLRGKFERFLQERFVDRDDLMRVKLSPGDCLVFHDRRTLHGRDPFEATQYGDRSLQALAFRFDASSAKPAG